jgi:hypothetical protein
MVFDLLDHVITRNISDPVDKFTDLGRFQSLEFELISPKIQSGSGEEVDKLIRDFTDPIASEHRLSRSKLTL